MADWYCYFLDKRAGLPSLFFAGNGRKKCGHFVGASDEEKGKEEKEEAARGK